MFVVAGIVQNDAEAIRTSVSGATLASSLPFDFCSNIGAGVVADGGAGSSSGSSPSSVMSIGSLPLTSFELSPLLDCFKETPCESPPPRTFFFTEFNDDDFSDFTDDDIKVNSDTCLPPEAPAPEAPPPAPEARAGVCDDMIEHEHAGMNLGEL